MRAVAIGVNWVLVGSQGTVGPGFADKIVAFDYLCRREETVTRRIEQVVTPCAVRCGIGCHGAGAAQVRMCIVNAAVKHGHPYASAIVPRILNGGCADIGDGCGEIQLVVNHGS